MDRRDFLKNIGLGGVALSSGMFSAKIIGKTSNGYLVESEEYGELPVEKLTGIELPYEFDPNILKKMENKNTIFSRNRWDVLREDRPKPNTLHEHLVEEGGKVPNQSRLDHAFEKAAWAMAYFPHTPCYEWESKTYMPKELLDMKLGPWNPSEIDMSWEELSLAVKHASLFYGASLAGIAELNPLWLYSNYFSPTKDNPEKAVPVLSEGDRFEKTDEAQYIPETMNRVITLAFEEDYDAMLNSPGRLASAATASGYSRMAFTSYTVAEFIRCLGYRAIPAGNGVGLSIPMAIDSGLGELGRMGLLITPKYGPRVRLAKVITDMPLVPDSPIRFGVEEFCEACMLCADHCPSNSVTKGPKTWSGKSPSNNNGVFKWYTEPETCFDFNDFSCSNCKVKCPFNKPNNSWLHKMIREGIDLRNETLDRVMVSLDQASGYGEELSAREFWKRDGNNSITARDIESE